MAVGWALMLWRGLTADGTSDERRWGWERKTEMGLSKQYIDKNECAQAVDFSRLSEKIQKACPDVVFCLVMGSARDGIVRAHSDLDLAVYLSGAHSFKMNSKISDIVDELCSGVRCDLGVLNNTEPVYRYEALKGRLLFTRDDETWLHFYSLTSREYESQIADYQRQLRYRVEAA